MKIETEPRDDHQIKVTAEFDASQLERYRQQAIRKISKEAKVPGFRPGKAPAAIIRRMFGDAAIQEQAIELMVDDVYPDILKEANINPSFPGSLEEIVSVDPPKFAFIVPLAPEVDLGSYRDIRKEYAPVDVTDEDVDAFIRRMQVSTVEPQPVERAAAQGDLVVLNVTGTLDEPDENGEQEFIRKTPYQVVIENADLSPDNWPYAGFSRELIGLSAGDTKDIAYTYPEDTEIEKVRGKSIVFHVEVEGIKAVELPVADDEFAKKMGGYEGIDQLRSVARDVISGNRNREYDDTFNRELVDQIVEQAVIKYPPQLLDEEIHQVMHNIEDNLARQRMDLDTYLKIMQMDKDTFIEKEARPAAESRIKRALVLDKITEAESIEVTEKDLQRAFNTTLNELSQSNEMEELQKRLSNKQLVDALSRQAANLALNQRIFRRLKSIATETEDVEPADSGFTPIDEMDALLDDDLGADIDEVDVEEEVVEENHVVEGTSEELPEADTETSAADPAEESPEA